MKRCCYDRGTLADDQCQAFGRGPMQYWLMLPMLRRLHGLVGFRPAVAGQLAAPYVSVA